MHRVLGGEREDTLWRNKVVGFRQHLAQDTRPPLPSRAHEVGDGHFAQSLQRTDRCLIECARRLRSLDARDGLHQWENSRGKRFVPHAVE